MAAALRWKGEGMSATGPLSPLDATFLELEEADVTAHMHIGGVLVFDPLPGGGTPTLARVRRHLERRLDALPRYRQRLSSRTTGGLHWPSWVPDERFDIAAHVTRAALPSPAASASAWAADFWSHRLDRGAAVARSPAAGAAGGRWALVTKTHHCLVDGVGSVDAGTVLLDAEPQPPRRRPAPPSPPDVEPHRPGAIRRLAALPLAATEAAVDVVRHPRRAAEGLDSARALVELLVRDELVAAPKNRPVALRHAPVQRDSDQRSRVADHAVRVRRTAAPRHPARATGRRARRRHRRLSYDDNVCFCVHADRDAVPDVDRIAAGIAAELEELGAVADHAATAAAREAALRR